MIVQLAASRERLFISELKKNSMPSARYTTQLNVNGRKSFQRLKERELRGRDEKKLKRNSASPCSYSEIGSIPAMPIKFQLYFPLISVSFAVLFSGCTQMDRDLNSLTFAYERGRLPEAEYRERFNTVLHNNGLPPATEMSSSPSSAVSYSQFAYVYNTRPPPANGPAQSYTPPTYIYNKQPSPASGPAQNYAPPTYIYNKQPSPASGPAQNYTPPTYIYNRQPPPASGPAQNYTPPTYIYNKQPSPASGPAQNYTPPTYIYNKPPPPSSGPAQNYTPPTYVYNKQPPPASSHAPAVQTSAQPSAKNQNAGRPIYVYQTRPPGGKVTGSVGGKPAPYTSDQLASYRKLGVVYYDLATQVYYIATDQPEEALKKFQNLYRSTQDVAQRLSDPTRWGLTIPQGPRENPLPKQTR